jgi:hypothetical protein
MYSIMQKQILDCSAEKGLQGGGLLVLIRRGARDAARVRPVLLGTVHKMVHTTAAQHDQ